MSGGEVMFFKKKKKVEERDFYCIAYFTGRFPDEEKTEAITDLILDETDNVGVISEYEEISPEDKRKIESRLPGIKLTVPGFAVIKIEPERIKEEREKLENKHKWKKFFDTIPLSDYLEVEHNATFEFHRTLLYSTDVQEVIAFLQKIDRQNAV